MRSPITNSGCVKSQCAEASTAASGRRWRQRTSVRGTPRELPPSSIRRRASRTPVDRSRRNRSSAWAPMASHNVLFSATIVRPAATSSITLRSARSAEIRSPWPGSSRRCWCAVPARWRGILN